MKSNIIFLIIFLLISQANSLSDTIQEEMHDDSQFPKVANLPDGTVLIFSPVIGVNKFLESKLDKKGEFIYSYISHNQSICANDVLATLYGVPESDSILIHHGSLPYEMISEYKKSNLVSSIKEPNSKYYAHKSVVALKCGKVLIAGIQGQQSDTILTDIDVNIYDPKTNRFGTGLTLDAYGKLVSCYEQKENQVYCAYVSQQYPYVSKLMLKYIEVNPTANTITAKSSQVIKTFYTVFNYLKAVTFSENQAIVLFRVGNGESLPRYGNSGKDLFYYHIEVSNEENGIISGIRYNYFESECRYRKDDEETIDIIPLLEKKIFIACESDRNRLKGYIIYPGKVEVDEFYFNNFNAKDIRNPVFAQFEKSLGIFYTHINENNNYNVYFHLMNYPECRNYYENNIIKIPRHFSKELDFSGYVFLNNPYPASRAGEVVKAKFDSYGNNMTIICKSTNQNLEVGTNYDSEKLILKLIPGDYEGIYTLNYVATLDDPLLGLIEGKTCKVNFEIPECLPQCYSCLDKGTPTEHKCLDRCINDSYYKEEYPGAKNEGYGTPFNCEKCNISCYNCWGKFYLDPIPSTNCKKCDYAHGYYHFFKDEKTCISVETQDYWEWVYNRSMYLDKTPENDPSQWRWRFCHPNCKKCSGPGDDIDNQCDVCVNDLHFFCNQTKGNGIPGSCHADCVNNGFFVKESEGMEKCCPCLGHCKVCPNNQTCDECYKPFYIKAPNKDECVEDCGYCYAKDNTNFPVWKCVDCKHDFPVEKFNLNGTCYDQIPLIEYEDPDVYGKPHHIADETCNWLIGCKGGCLICDTWYTEKCTKCKPNYFAKDYYSLEQPHTFPCLTENECKGLERYKYNESEEHGGVPKVIGGEGVCYNCRLRENNYCQVNDNFVCGPRPPTGTYIKIPHYNKLDKCFIRCKTCEQFGNSCKHNCLSCRDPSVYSLTQYPNSEEGNCMRIQHHCGTYPYYHNYDLAKELGLDDNNCGEACDVCLYNRSCTEQFPYYVIATRECVETCGFNEILGQSCLMDQSNALDRFMKDPFETGSLDLNQISDPTIKEIIIRSIVERYAKILKIDATVLEQNIYNFIGNGKVFNLPNSEIIAFNNISIELTTNELELLKILNLKRKDTVTATTPDAAATVNTAATESNAGASSPTFTQNSSGLPKGPNIKATGPTSSSTSESTTKIETATPINTTEGIPKIEDNNLFLFSQPTPITDVNQPAILNLTDCETILKKQYNLPADEKLIILKGSIFKEFNQYIGNDLNYQIMSSSLMKILDLSYCREKGIYSIITDFFSPGNLVVSQRQQYKIAAAIYDGYDVFNFDSAFYNDICTPFTNEYGYDVLLDQRKTDYFDETLHICKDNCKFYGYNATTNAFSCACPVAGDDINDEKQIITQELPKDFYKTHTNSNIKVFKCASQVFSSKGQKKNFGSYVLLACLASFVGVAVFYFIKGQKLLKEMFSGFDEIRSNPPKKVEITDKNDIDSNKRSIGIEDVKKDELLSEVALNNASWDDAKDKENRSYLKIYWSLLKMKQLFIFTFYTNNDGNLRVIKIGLFILFVSFYFAFTALFFNDKIMRNIYIYNGNTDAALHIPNIILSSLFCLISNLLIKFVSLSERTLLQIKNKTKKKEDVEKIIKIKTTILFIISFILIGLCWYYVSAFCAIFKNSQGHYFTNVLFAFIVCNIWPCVTTLIAPAMRKYAFKNDSSCMYKASKIVAYI